MRRGLELHSPPASSSCSSGARASSACAIIPLLRPARLIPEPSAPPEQNAAATSLPRLSPAPRPPLISSLLPRRPPAPPAALAWNPRAAEEVAAAAARGSSVAGTRAPDGSTGARVWWGEGGGGRRDDGVDVVVDWWQWPCGGGGTGGDFFFAKKKYRKSTNGEAAAMGGIEPVPSAADRNQAGHRRRPRRRENNCQGSRGRQRIMLFPGARVAGERPTQPPAGRLAGWLARDDWPRLGGSASAAWRPGGERILPSQPRRSQQPEPRASQTRARGRGRGGTPPAAPPPSAHCSTPQPPTADATRYVRPDGTPQALLMLCGFPRPAGQRLLPRNGQERALVHVVLSFR
jgi:hypothetical protein